MIIQQLGEESAKALIELRQQAIGEYPQYFSPTVEELTAGLEPIEERLHSPDDSYLGAWQERQLVGMVHFEREKYTKLRHQARVGSLYVVTEHRRRGVGRALMCEVITRAREAGVDQLVLEVGNDNEKAHRLYAALGFRVYARAPRVIKVCDLYYDEDLMVLFLPH